MSPAQGGASSHRLDDGDDNNVIDRCFSSFTRGGALAKNRSLRAAGAAQESISQLRSGLGRWISQTSFADHFTHLVVEVQRANVAATADVVGIGVVQQQDFN